MGRRIVRRAAKASWPIVARKPMARVEKLSWFEKEIRISLSRTAVELALRGSRALSEGRLEGAAYHGSTMVTVELPGIEAWFREPSDAATAIQIASLLIEDPHVRSHLVALGTREAELRAGRPLDRVQVELRARAVGARVHLDVDVEAHVLPTPTRPTLRLIR